MVSIASRRRGTSGMRNCRNGTQRGKSQSPLGEGALQGSLWQSSVDDYLSQSPLGEGALQGSPVDRSRALASLNRLSAKGHLRARRKDFGSQCTQVSIASRRRGTSGTRRTRRRRRCACLNRLSAKGHFRAGSPGRGGQPHVSIASRRRGTSGLRGFPWRMQGGVSIASRRRGTSGF